MRWHGATNQAVAKPVFKCLSRSHWQSPPKQQRFSPAFFTFGETYLCIFKKHLRVGPSAISEWTGHGRIAEWLPCSLSRPNSIWKKRTTFVNYGFRVTQVLISDHGGALWRVAAPLQTRLSVPEPRRGRSVPVLFISIRGIYPPCLSIKPQDASAANLTHGTEKLPTWALDCIRTGT